MHIGLVLPAVPSYSETFFHSKIKGLISSGHEVSLFVTNRKGNSSHGYQVYYAPNISKNPIRRYAISLWNIIKLFVFSFKSARNYLKLERKYLANSKDILRRCVINSHILPMKLDWLHFEYATMAIERELVSKAIGAKMAVSFRGYDIGIYPNSHPGCYNTLWQHVDLIHTISNDLLDEAYTIGLNKKTPVVKITPAIDIGKFPFKPRDFFMEDKIRILTVGRLHWKKGLEYTLESISLLKNRGIKIEYTIVGEGVELERLTYAAYQLGIISEVKFRGVVSPNEVGMLMQNHDIYIQYSVQEGFCNAVIEAQASGLLCIVSDAEGLAENVLNGNTGWVVPKRNPELLAAKFETIIKLPQSTLKMISQQAANRAATEFDIKKQQKEFVEFYNFNSN